MAQARRDAPPLPAAEAAFRDGVALHDAGRAAEAAARFRAALRAQPDFVAAQYNLGLALTDAGESDAAADAFRAALRRAPGLAEAHSNLGNILLAQGRAERAEASFRSALRLRPGQPDFWVNLALALIEQRRPAEAEQALGQALGLRPDHGRGLRLLAQMRARAGDTQGALVLLRRRLGAEPHVAQALTDPAELLLRLGRFAEARPLFQAALDRSPADTAIMQGLAACLEGEGRAAAALPLRETVAAACPGDARAHNALARPLFEAGRLEEALAACRRALALDPAYADAFANEGNVLAALTRFDEARAAYITALRHDPLHANAEASIGMLDLLHGRFAEGLPRYEARLRIHRARDFSQPRWDGAAGGAVLLHAEQGFGDTIQFARFAPVAALRAAVVLLVPASLARLMRSLPGPLTVVADGAPLPPFDTHCPLLSVPLALGATLESIPADIPYLRPDPAEVAAWRSRLAGMSGLRVGLAWAGSADFARDGRRSIDGDRLAPLLSTAGATFVSLQKPARPAPAGGALIDWTEELRDFADTAALIAALDLVIAVDTAVAHLAGALGTPVWLLNRADTDWRWFLKRHDSPWYPSMRIFRQPEPGDWTTVLAQVADELAVSARLRDRPP